VLLGATGIAVAAAGTMFGGGAANAAPAAGPMSVEIAGLGSFEVLAFSWGASNSGSMAGSGGGAGKANIQDVSLTKHTDQHSPALLSAVTVGEHFSKATLTFTPPGGRSPLVLEMTPVMVTSVSLGGTSDEMRLTENLTLNFASFRFAYGQASTDFDISRS
jgi:type VI secretion system secreted protein Hcp